MLKERQSHAAAPRASTSRAPHRNAIAPPEVAIIPGNRFFLLPLKKVCALVRHHEHVCRGASATATKTCIESKAPASRAVTASKAVPHTDKSLRSSTRSTVRRRRRRHPAIAKSHLGPISEQAPEDATQPLLDAPWNRGPDGARSRRQFHLETAENARRMNTHTYLQKPGRQEQLQPGRCTLASAKAASAVDYSSRLRVECAQQAAPMASPGLTSRTVVLTKRNGPATGGYWSQNRWRSKGTSVFSLDQPGYPGGTRVIPKTRFGTEGGSVSEPAGIVLKHQGGVSAVDGHPRGKGKKKLRNLVVLPRIQAFGRNRVSPSDHQILLPTGRFNSETSIVEASSVRDSFGRVGEVSKSTLSTSSRRVRCRDGRDSFGGCSGVQQTRSTWRISPFVCSLANENDLPIGPLRGGGKQQLLR